MKKLLMLSAVAMAALFASCDDEEVIDYSAVRGFHGDPTELWWNRE